MTTELPECYLPSDFLVNEQLNVTSGYFLVGNHIVGLSAGMDEESIVDYGYDLTNSSGIEMKAILEKLTDNFNETVKE